jgi:hypothetical protein
LNSKSREYIAGLATIGQVTITAAVETDDTAFPALDTLATSGLEIPWFIGLSDGTTPPTMTAKAMTPPTDRSGWTFNGFVASVSPQIEQNNVVKYEVVITPAARMTWHQGSGEVAAPPEGEGFSGTPTPPPVRRSASGY